VFTLKHNSKYCSAINPLYGRLGCRYAATR
jgi:hypothetical protein